MKRKLAEAAEALCQKYKMKHAIVVPHDNDYGLLKKSFGKEAAGHFERVIADLHFPRVGIGGGSTIYEMVMSCKTAPRHIRVYPTALVGRGPEIEFVDSSFLATALFMKSKPLARGYCIGIPPLPQQKKEAESFHFSLLKKIPEIELLLKSARKCDVVFVGLGSMMPVGDVGSEMKKLGVTMAELEKSGVVGGINYNWFDLQGNQVGDYFLTLRVADLKRLAADDEKHVVLVGGGDHKAQAASVILKAKMVNTIITDTHVAEELLR